MAQEQWNGLQQRLVNQKLAGSDLNDAAAVVSWLGAVQAQDFPAARWAVGLRGRNLTDEAVKRAFDDGAILRTHVLRPTWHFVTPADIRWMVALTGARIAAKAAHRRRQLEIDARTLSTSRRTLGEALAFGRYLTRPELGAALERSRVRVTPPERLTHILFHAEAEGLICSGPIRGGRVTYALLDERVPGAPAVSRDEALARLALRYFTSRGPATVADFAWWSGLPLREARVAAELAGFGTAGQGRTKRTARPTRGRAGARAWLLPNFDEFLVAYRDRTSVLGGIVHSRDALTNTVILGGRAVAAWRGARQKDRLSVSLVPRTRLSAEDLRCIREAADRYGAFLGQPVSLQTD
jgi:hypothetical protein